MTQAVHALVAGSSGGGKTTLLREMHDSFSGPSIFLTSKPTDSLKENPPKSIVKTSAVYDDDITKARQWALARPGAVQIIVDEVQFSGLADGGGPIARGLHEDRDRGIKWVLATQSPQDLRGGYTSLQQVQSIYWVGPAKTFHEGFFRYYRLTDINFPEQRFKYIKIIPSLPPVVHGPYSTKKKYG